MITDFTSLSDEAKIWIYPSSRKFYTNEIEEIDTKIKAFVESWKKEAQDFKCSYQFLYNRFIIIGAEDETSSVSNQDMDVLVGFILELQETYEVELLDRMNVCFKQGEYVQYKELKDFKKLVKNKAVTAKTIIFDNLITSKHDFQNYWEVAIEDSWYNRFL
jgi:hypothetical protein|tara:strand:- start:32772 stop:33254 length:483 start_codon:yes stop_codon:yes gene_type:complete